MKTKFLILLLGLFIFTEICNAGEITYITEDTVIISGQLPYGASVAYDPINQRYAVAYYYVERISWKVLSPFIAVQFIDKDGNLLGVTQGSYASKLV